jgi:hypothetical protein
MQQGWLGPRTADSGQPAANISKITYAGEFQQRRSDLFSHRSAAKFFIGLSQSTCRPDRRFYIRSAKVIRHYNRFRLVAWLSPRKLARHTRGGSA